MKRPLQLLLIFVCLCPPLWAANNTFSFGEQVDFLPADEAFIPELLILDEKHIQIAW